MLNSDLNVLYKINLASVKKVLLKIMSTILRYLKDLKTPSTCPSPWKKSVLLVAVIASYKIPEVQIKKINMSSIVYHWILLILILSQSTRNMIYNA